VKTFRILHPIGGTINHDLERGLYEYEEIADIKATSLNNAFLLSQNDFSNEYASLNKRSTCVGDIIIDDENNHWFIHGKGFLSIPSTVAQYIDWSNH